MAPFRPRPPRQTVRGERSDVRSSWHPATPEPRMTDPWGRSGTRRRQVTNARPSNAIPKIPCRHGFRSAAPAQSGKRRATRTRSFVHRPLATPGLGRPRPTRYRASGGTAGGPGNHRDHKAVPAFGDEPVHADAADVGQARGVKAQFLMVRIGPHTRNSCSPSIGSCEKAGTTRRGDDLGSARSPRPWLQSSDRYRLFQKRRANCDRRGLQIARVPIEYVLK